MARAYTITRPRVIETAVVVGLCLIGAVLPYFRITYQDFASQVVSPTRTLFPTGGFLRRLNIGYFPSAEQVGPDSIQRAVDVATFAATAQQVGMIVAILTIAGIFMNEINKFLWWPLFVSSWLLILGAVALFVGAALFRSAQVEAHVRFGWLPLLVAGIAVIVICLRSRSRMDSYRGV